MTVVTDKQGNRYYDVEEAMRVLDVKRSTLAKLVADLTRYRQKERDGRKVFYRAEEIEALRNQPVEMERIEEVKPQEIEGRAAMPACA